MHYATSLCSDSSSSFLCMALLKSSSHFLSVFICCSPFPSLFHLYWPLCCQIYSPLRAFALIFSLCLETSSYRHLLFCSLISFRFLITWHLGEAFSVHPAFNIPAPAFLSCLLSLQHLSASAFLCILLRWKLILFTAVSPCLGQCLDIVRNLVNIC